MSATVRQPLFTTQSTLCSFITNLHLQEGQSLRLSEGLSRRKESRICLKQHEILQQMSGLSEQETSSKHCASLQEKTLNFWGRKHRHRSGNCLRRARCLSIHHIMKGFQRPCSKQARLDFQ